jgi:hypothetical protein
MQEIKSNLLQYCRFELAYFKASAFIHLMLLLVVLPIPLTPLTQLSNQHQSLHNANLTNQNNDKVSSPVTQPKSSTDSKAVLVN